MENYTSGTGQQLKVHDRAVCSALRGQMEWCVIHKPKPNHMAAWPTHWRTSWGGFMERLCPHGIGHPAAEENRPGGFGHGCDGCCHESLQSEPESGLRYSQGGLMRCCIQTLTDAATEGDGHIEGSELTCRWCQTKMILDRGVWQWDKKRSWYTPEAKQA